MENDNGDWRSRKTALGPYKQLNFNKNLGSSQGRLVKLV